MTILHWMQHGIHGEKWNGPLGQWRKLTRFAHEFFYVMASDVQLHWSNVKFHVVLERSQATRNSQELQRLIGDKTKTVSSHHTPRCQINAPPDL